MQVFDKAEAELAKAMMSLPATKGFEIGEVRLDPRGGVRKSRVQQRKLYRRFPRQSSWKVTYSLLA